MVPVRKKGFGNGISIVCSVAAYDGTSAYRISIKKPASFRHESEEKKAAIEQAVSCTGLKPYETVSLGNFPEVSVKGLPCTGHCGETFNPSDG